MKTCTLLDVPALNWKYIWRAQTENGQTEKIMRKWRKGIVRLSGAGLLLVCTLKSHPPITHSQSHSALPFPVNTFGLYLYYYYYSHPTPSLCVPNLKVHHKARILSLFHTHTGTDARTHARSTGCFTFLQSINSCHKIMEEMYGFRCTPDFSDQAPLVAFPADFQAFDEQIPIFRSPEQMFSGTSSSAISDAASIQRNNSTGSEDDISSAIRAKIASHPLYPKLLQAYIDCQKVNWSLLFVQLLLFYLVEGDLIRCMWWTFFLFFWVTFSLLFPYTDACV